MKRLFSLLMLLCFFLTGCGIFGERIKEPVTFYYLRSDYQYFMDDGVIASEEREASGHREDLSYLLALYLMGPSEENLKSPLPRGTNIYSAEVTEDGILLQLSDTSAMLTDIDFSAAGACLSLTCFGLTDAESVTINSGERSLTIRRDSLLLYDNNIAVEEQK